MTSRNLHLNEPFLLRPSGKEKLWGGNRLNDDFCKNIEIFPLAETWECSTYPTGHSFAASGKYSGKTLADILDTHPEYVGTHPDMRNGLPILVKFIDAETDLSIQVHPDDDYAETLEGGGQWGKTEMWYVLDARKNAKIIYGLNQPITVDEMRENLYNGGIEKYLQKIPVQKDDVFFIKPGTIHAIGAGILIAEIQESSDLTYRLYDYDRVDKNGNKRELHVEKALQVANLNASDMPHQPMRVLKYRMGWASELLCQCKYFRVERILLNTERIRNMVRFSTDSLSFAVLLCVDGCGTIFWSECKAIRFFKGDCVFVPADSVTLNIHGCAQLLYIRC